MEPGHTSEAEERRLPGQEQDQAVAVQWRPADPAGDEREVHRYRPLEWGSREPAGLGGCARGIAHTTPPGGGCGPGAGVRGDRQAGWGCGSGQAAGGRA